MTKFQKKRTLEPYALKEFNQQWYLLANERDSSNFKIKTFGLDKISKQKHQILHFLSSIRCKITIQ